MIHDKLLFMMKTIIYILFFLLVSGNSFSQQDNLKTSSQFSTKNQLEEQIFREIGNGLNEGNVNDISKHFGSQTYFSLSNGINGYYSSNQAFYILEDYFKIYKALSFKFDHIKTDKNSSYATGKYSYDNRGKRNNAQVYISLKKVGNNWNITQLTIN